MDIEDMRKLLDELAAFMKKNDLAELEVDVDGAQVKLRKAGGAVQPQVVAHPAVAARVPVAQDASARPAEPEETEAEVGAELVTSPMVGTFYRAPDPEADSFVEVGDEVDEDTVLCIIEAMKVMNEIKAERKGHIVKIALDNGEAVEYGQTLFLIAASQ